MKPDLQHACAKRPQQAPEEQQPMSLKTKRAVKQINLFSSGIASQLCSALLLGDVLQPLLEVTKELSSHIALHRNPLWRTHPL